MFGGNKYQFNPNRNILAIKIQKGMCCKLVEVPPHRKHGIKLMMEL